MNNGNNVVIIFEITLCLISFKLFNCALLSETDGIYYGSHMRPTKYRSLHS